MGNPPAKPKVTPGATAAAPPPTGCCDISLPDGTGQQFEHITEEDCRQRGIALGGAVAWVPGECA
jgi:hypothetical protein